MTSPDSTSKRPFVIGVTGNIACGKSTVLRELSRLGAETIDADAVYHQLIQPGSSLWRQIVDHFGDWIMDSSGQIDRKSLGQIVFREPAALAELEKITHPAIRASIVGMLDQSRARIVAIDAVKLIEGGFNQQCDSVWIVTCRTDQQIERLIRYRGLAMEDAKLRIAAQPLVEPKLDLVDVLIDNSGDLESMLTQVRQAWDQLGLADSAI